MAKTFKFHFLALVVLILSSVSAMGQLIKFNPKFDAVSEDEVKMTSYSRDTAADALIIYQNINRRVYITPAGDFMVDKTNRMRIKILKESAKDLATFRMLYRTDGEMSEKITDIKVITYNWENGKVVKTKMDKKFIFDKKFSEKSNSISFTAQNVKVGSVVEITYTRKNMHFWDLGEINFQGEYPVNCIEAKITFPEYFKYNVLSRGKKYFDLNVKQETENLVTGHGGNLDYGIIVENYRAVNVPALRKESHLYCVDQFYCAVEYELRTLQLPRQIPKNFGSSWTDVDKQVYDTRICTDITSSCKFKKEVDEIKAKGKSFIEQVVEIRNLVCDRVKWNKEVRLVPSANVSTLIKDGSGSTADINALVGNALNYAGFEVHPVLLKLRTSGEFADFHVSADAFDTFILKVSDKAGQTVYLDAARKEAYLNVLHDNYIVAKARELAKGSVSKWVDLTHLCENIAEFDVKAKLDEDGLMTGKMTITAKNNESYDLKRYFNSFEKEEDLIAKLESGNSYTVESISSENMNDYTPECKLEFSFEQQMQTAQAQDGELIYLKPIIETLHSDKYFKSETRSVPIDIDHINKIVYHISVEIPDGYVFEQIPVSEHMGAVSTDVRASVENKTSEDGKTLEVTYTITENAMYVDPHNYADYRRFWQQLVKTESETIVLKKK